MATLTLNGNKTKLLHGVLTEQLLELHTEISPTDRREFRENLKKMEGPLQHLLVELELAAKKPAGDDGIFGAEKDSRDRPFQVESSDLNTNRKCLQADC
jgi:hypothetical protein